VLDLDSPLGPAPEPVDPLRAPTSTRASLLAVTSVVVGGRLTVTITYSSNLHAQSTIDTLLAQYLGFLREMLETRKLGLRAYSPSDFPDAHIDRAALARTLLRVKGASTVK